MATCYAIKTEIADAGRAAFEFAHQKTMYGGKHIAIGDTVYLFASENEGGTGLVAKGVVTVAKPTPPKPGIERQTPRVSITVRRTARAARSLGRTELKPHAGSDESTPQGELHFKFYRQATNKIVGISDATAAFLDTCF